LKNITNCFKCGARLPEGSNYCFKCGLELKITQIDSIFSKDTSKADSHYYEKASYNFFISGVTLFKDGEYSKSITKFTQAIELKKDFAEAYYNRGKAYVKESKYDNAIADFTKSIEINPEFKEAYFQRGNLFFEKGFKERAREDYEKIIELDFEIASQLFDKLHNFMESWVINIIRTKTTSADVKKYIGDS